jgi:hypothetical protein
MFLAWSAPYGTPGARDEIVVACDDTTRSDTLFITFDPGMDAPNLLAVEATLTFRAAPGDSLGPFWDLSRRGRNPWNLRVEYDEPPAGVESPWPVAGVGSVSYQLGKDAGRTELSYYVAASKSGPVAAGTRYFYARVILRDRQIKLKGCTQPVCVEVSRLWVERADKSVPAELGDRFVSRNSPGSKVCTTYRTRSPMPWPTPFVGGTPPDSAK